MTDSIFYFKGVMTGPRYPYMFICPEVENREKEPGFINTYCWFHGYHEGIDTYNETFYLAKLLDSYSPSPIYEEPVAFPYEIEDLYRAYDLATNTFIDKIGPELVKHEKKAI